MNFSSTFLPIFVRSTSIVGCFGLLSLSASEDSIGSRYQSQSLTMSSGDDVLLRNLPFAVDVYTDDYLSDVGTTLFGFGIPYQSYGGSIQTRMGFKYRGLFDGVAFDAVNVSTLEMSRGPGAILYGINDPSGSINIDPKKPLDEPFYSVSIYVNDTEDESGYFRTSLEATGPLYKGEEGDVLAYRFAASFDEGGRKDLEHYVGQLEYENEKVKAFAEVQHATMGVSNSFSPSLYDPAFELANEYEETSVLLNVDLSPIDNLVISLGTFLSETEADTDSFRSWYGEQSASNYIQTNNNDRQSEEYRLDVSYSFKTSDLFGSGEASHLISVGANEFIENVDSSLLSDYLFDPYSPLNEISDYVSRNRSFGTYAKYDGRFVDDKLGFSVGVRKNDYNRWIDELGDIRSRVSTMDYSDEVSRFLGLSYQLNDWLSVYANHEEGLIPDLVDDSQGLDYDTERHELGVKFSALEGRLNARISGYQIEKTGEGIEGVTSYSQFISSAIPVVDENNYTPISFGRGAYYDLFEGVETGDVVPNPDDFVSTLPVDYTYRELLERAFADTSRNGDESSVYQPIIYSPTPVVSEYEISSTEEIDGFDLNVNYALNDNWEFLLTYMHEKSDTSSIREFVLQNTTYIDEGGTEYTFGSEYDAFVRTFGREAFGLIEIYEYDENGDIVLDANGNRKVIDVQNSNGESVTVGDYSPINFVPDPSIFGSSNTSDHASLFTHYTVSEGTFRGVSLWGGLVYSKNQVDGFATSLGSDQLPFSSEVHQVNVGLSYEWEMSNINYRVQLNIDNLENTKTDTATWLYQSYDGSLVEEEVELYRSPRTYQFRFTAEF